MKNKLAIVIPAYKARFFNDTLQSIADQTCKDFTLYIGDDASQDNLLEIVDRYHTKLSIAYKRFHQNLGGDDLVAHWNRCIDLVGEEKWIWLFSDDDLMDSKCVEQFYGYIRTNENVELLHFNVKIINDSGSQIFRNERFPSKLHPSDFFKLLVTSRINSFVVEYIFSKDLYVKEGGFEKFDLGWCADAATWIKFSAVNGMDTIEGAEVSWRYSGFNISSEIKDKRIVERKLTAYVRYLQWISVFFREKKLIDLTTEFEKIKFPLSMICSSPFSFLKKIDFVFVMIKQLGYKRIYLLSFIYLLYLTIKKRLSGRTF